LDRLGRSVSDVTRIVEKFQDNGVFLVVVDQAIDTRKIGSGMEGMMTKALITLLSLMAEMERTFIMERTRPAIEQAKKNGVKFGQPRKSKKEYAKAVELYLTGNYTVPQVLNEYTGLTEATFFRRLKERKEELGLS
jgi:DNA invertase Pin-like site-specific DNA recombinase